MRIRHWVAGLALMGLAGTALAQGNVIAERREGLKRMGAHMDAIKPVAEARGDVRTLVPRLDDMLTFFRGLPNLFPPGSGTGDTKARPEIWQNFADFQTLDARLVGQLETLRTAAAAGDAAAFAAAYQVTGAQYCGACHRNYRAR
ncbi:cytochrome c [Siccirubricoccus sp. KC 17139]|uniref:Cytochrome c n=1 Tax=Siccirubricoccus soli TaxID=2899147 RepID=A0ABT1DGI5_9PROT|nr:cytochrome c [Siccirubricoccus soli]MCO6420030.1 cytochrome c [Siccirubricoccus soli]MCP2686167.1 cytochrome c [Siccirubricoccus soli]